MKFLSFINLPCGHVMSHKKFGSDRFSRFDVYWIQTDRQTNKQTDKPNLYIEDLHSPLNPNNSSVRGLQITAVFEGVYINGLK